jgi:hypothetical protein
LKTPPDCAKCGSPHWRFVKCADAPAAAAKHQAAVLEQERRKVVPIWRNDNDRAWNSQPGWESGQFHRNEFTNPRPPEAA